MSRTAWELPYGAQIKEEGGIAGTRFRVAAPGKKQVELALARPGGYNFLPLEAEGNGNFSAFLPHIEAGVRYKFRIDGDMVLPDPYTRSQPDDVHGDCEIVDALAYEWHDDEWRGLKLNEMIIYELHVGTFTAAGTFTAIIERLDYLLSLGVNTIELLPVAEFPGGRNWGYDGVQYFAPDASYGGPQGLKQLIDAAHQRGIAVIIDVVYNHFGPDGNYLWSYSRDYFTPHHKTPWGDAPNFDSRNAELMRTYVAQNALFWIHEYHADGLRMDATFAMIDESKRHILREIVHACHSNSRNGLPVTLIAEDHRNLAWLNWPEPEGFGFDGQWVDDLHHAIHCYFTKEHEGYYKNYRGTMEELVKTLNNGFLYQGEHYQSWDGPRGTAPERLAGHEMIVCIQNHDQVGNRAFGERLNHLLDRDSYHVAAALLLLSPYTPMLFMGQEYGARQPFLFFTEHHAELGEAVTAGRREEFREFADFDNEARRATIPDPQAEETFLRSKLDLSEHAVEPYAQTFRLHQRLLWLVHNMPGLNQRVRAQLYAFSPAAGLLAFRRGPAGQRYFLIANLTASAASCPLEALSAALSNAESDELPDWSAPLFATLDIAYGGSGAMPAQAASELQLPPHSLFLYKLF